MRVKVSVVSILRKVVGEGTFYMELEDNSTLEALVKELAMIYGEAFKEEVGKDMAEALKRYFNIFVNGRIRDISKGKDFELKEGDEVLIVQPVGGG